MPKNKIKYIPQGEELPTAIAIYGIADKHSKKPVISFFRHLGVMFLLLALNAALSIVLKNKNTFNL